MVRVIAGILALLSFIPAAVGQTPGGGGIVFGKDHAFSIIAPPGWVLDNSSGKAQGLHAVLYPEGESWANAKTVMYANTASKRVEGQRTVEELMEYDLRQFRKRAPSLAVTALPELSTSSGKAAVRRFEGDEHGNHEAVAYIDEKHTIVMLVLTSRTKAGFESAYPHFEKLVRSYEFLARK